MGYFVNRRPAPAPFLHWSQRPVLRPVTPPVPRQPFTTAGAGRGWTTFDPLDFAFVPNRTPVVYAFYRCGQLVYIGRTNNLRARLVFHRNQRSDCDLIKACVIGQQEHRAWLEQRLIRRLKPIENQQFAGRNSQRGVPKPRRQWSYD